MLTGFHLYGMSRIGKSTDVETRLAVSRRGLQEVGIGSGCQWVMGFFLNEKKMFWNWIMVMIAHRVNILATTDLYTLKGQTLWHVSYAE